MMVSPSAEEEQLLQPPLSTDTSWVLLSRVMVRCCAIVVAVAAFEPLLPTGTV